MNPVNIGRYVIKSEIARGGMATVYLAFDPYVKREVAIKLLPANLTHDLSFRARFEREAQTVAALEYPAIVPVYDFGEEAGQPYLVMRYMPGGSLSQKIESGPLSLNEVSRIFSRLSGALDHVHGQGIIHRDLKPANVLFDTYNNAYLSDFGIAHIAAGNAAITGEKMVGTPAYMSPEQARGDTTIDGSSDIYSMGAILFEALTGRQPYQGTTPMGVAVKHITEPIPQLKEINAELPSQCQDVIDMAMAKDVNQRYRSAASMAQALMLIASKTLKTPPIPEEEPTARILAPIPLRAHKPSNPLDVQSHEPSLSTSPPPADPVSTDQSVPPIEKPYQPAAPSGQPGNTPVQPLQPPSKLPPDSQDRRLIWVWALLAAAILGALCLLIIILLWLFLSGIWHI